MKLRLAWSTQKASGYPGLPTETLSQKTNKKNKTKLKSNYKVLDVSEMRQQVKILSQLPEAVPPQEHRVQCRWRPEEGVGSSRAGIPGSCEPPGMGAGNQLMFLARAIMPS